MANTSTDELGNAAHHLELAIELERRSPERRLEELALMQRALDDLDQVLDVRCGPKLPALRLGRLIPFRRR